MAARKKPSKKRKIVKALTSARKRIVLQSLRGLNAKIQLIEKTLIECDFDDL
jgi:hypothetical protein